MKIKLKKVKDKNDRVGCDPCFVFKNMYNRELGDVVNYKLLNLCEHSTCFYGKYHYELIEVSE
jgi:hypothetical protein